MIAHTRDSSPFSRSPRGPAWRPDPIDDFGDDLDGEEGAGEAADTLRMIELSGMVGIEPRLFDAE